jgi:nucleoredoxin
LVGKEGQKVLVSDLVGKHVLLYFSAHWCPPCRAFTPKLVEAYNEIKGKVEAFEIIFISSDKDQNAFDEYYATMPWLALPFGDDRKLPLSRKFKVKGIPTLVALGPTGKTVTTEARNLVMQYGAKAFPFTKEQLEKLEAENAEVAKGWPEKVKHGLHEAHELVLSKRTSYVCDGCNEGGEVWSYLCKECDFDLHPKCALEEKKDEKDDAGDDDGEEVDDAVDAVDADEVKEDGVKCDGDVCHRT